jgi:hypothetical protein
MIEATPYEPLPANWSYFDLKGFSRQKQLWDYQQEAVRSAIAGLWKYNEEFADYRRGENSDVNLERKRRFPAARSSHPGTGAWRSSMTGLGEPQARIACGVRPVDFTRLLPQPNRRLAIAPAFS